MGATSEKASGAIMLVLLVCSLAPACLALPAAEAEAEAEAGPHGYYGHGYHGPLCTHALEEKTQEVCYYEPEKVCETKTYTYKQITGYEDVECKDIEVCKHPGFHKRSAEAEAEPHYGYPYVHVECEKETKEICKKKPVVEEKSEDKELCRFQPKKVCEEKTFKVPKLVCEELEKEEEE